ncbi:hypothetical protein OPV22_017584 [Ensete ventricosum]|uniref:CASP-like protein n=1 Tax=Ensete ventricosum TaxID=4639 RepID=A0AAV8R2B9_ENSVE|nr:hypothetical protein OPV22_017584 [Ensete ventricosum]
MAKESLAGPGAGASAARAVVAVAAATKMAQAIFLISMVGGRRQESQPPAEFVKLRWRKMAWGYLLPPFQA